MFQNTISYIQESNIFSAGLYQNPETPKPDEKEVVVTTPILR